MDQKRGPRLIRKEMLMKITNKNHNKLKGKLMALYAAQRDKLAAMNGEELLQLRDKAIAYFDKNGFPDEKTESWRNTDISEYLDLDYQFHQNPPQGKVNVEEFFQCDLHHFDTFMATVVNGWFVQKDGPMQTLPSGTIIGGLRDAMKEFPELTHKHLTRYATCSDNSFGALNTALFQDGVFIYVPDNTEVTKPLQMVNILNSDEQQFVQTRNLIIVGKNSKLTLVHCDDALNQNRSFANTVTEVFVDENGEMDHYKLQNLNNQSALVSQNCFHLSKDSRLSTNSISLNGGIIRNESRVALTGSGGSADVLGLYLMDKNQHIDNQVYVDHQVDNCYSNEQFKGILDDYASAVFNGHIHVARDAQKTNAFQNSRNILLTDKARVNAKPFLEIYADDVKCSHGATVGQLDKEALFYLRSRGISTDNARMLLMYAFAAEISNKIKIESLQIQIDDMIKKRLRGELSICEQCVLNCRNPEQPLEFKIDPDKI